MHDTALPEEKLVWEGVQGKGMGEGQGGQIELLVEMVRRRVQSAALEVSQASGVSVSFTHADAEVGMGMDGLQQVVGRGCHSITLIGRISCTSAAGAVGGDADVPEVCTGEEVDIEFIVSIDRQHPHTGVDEATDGSVCVVRVCFSLTTTTAPLQASNDTR